VRYKTKTIEVEAHEFNGTVASGEQLAARFPQAIYVGRNGTGDYDGRLIMQTNGGPVNVPPESFIVVEGDGGLTVLNHIAFNAKYERVVTAPTEATT
jgi:flagellar basal body rod protein FlgF